MLIPRQPIGAATTFDLLQMRPRQMSTTGWSCAAAVVAAEYAMPFDRLDARNRPTWDAAPHDWPG